MTPLVLDCGRILTVRDTASTYQELHRPGVDLLRPGLQSKPMTGRPPWLDIAIEQMNQTAFIMGIGGELADAWPIAKGRLPYSENLVGDPQTGVVHGGVITGLLDHTCGLAVMSKLRTFM